MIKNILPKQNVCDVLPITSQIARQIKPVGGFAQISARGWVRHHIGNQRHLDYLMYSLFVLHLITNEVLSSALLVLNEDNHGIQTRLAWERQDGVIKWKFFPRYWPFVRGFRRSPVDSPHKDQWRGALMFSLICAWTNGWTNNWKAGKFRHHRAHYDVIVMNKVVRV